MDGRNPHAVLGVDECASPDQVKRAFRARALVAHPDRGGRREDFEAIVAAAEALLGRHRHAPSVRRSRPNPFAATLAPSISTWAAYDSPPAPRRRPSFAAILREELARAA